MVLQYAFLALLAASVVSFVAMGAAKTRRTGRLAREAHQAARRFFRDDPYDAPRRYGRFAVISAGHSGRAYNVTDGRLAGRPIRAFDFRYEIGHGTHRIAGHCTVVVAEMGWTLPELLMWHEEDMELAPLVARDAAGRAGRWAFRGPPAVAAAVAAAWAGLDLAAASLELRGSALLVSAPAGRAKGYAIGLADVEAAAAAVGRALGRPDVQESESGQAAAPAQPPGPHLQGTGKQGVAKPPGPW